MLFKINNYLENGAEHFTTDTGSARSAFCHHTLGGRDNRDTKTVAN
jgi:hypothetical protein